MLPPAGSIRTVGLALRCDRRPATVAAGFARVGNTARPPGHSPPYEVPMRTRKPSSGDLPLDLAPESPSEPAEASSKADRQEFFLPVNGFVWFYPEEVEIINHPAFQRLARINQLGQAYYVFRGATHKRIEHVLGVVGVVQQMISAVRVNADKARRKGGVGLSAPLSESEERFVRLGALLHDIGHLAAGHTLEDELELIGKHDADRRLDLILDLADWDGSAGRGVPTLRQVIDAQYTRYVPPRLAANGITPTELVRLLIRKRPDRKDDRYAEWQAQLERSCEVRLDVCSNMIGNTICADLLDYIYRDWYHVGIDRRREDRIFQYMEIRRPGAHRALGNAKPLPANHEDRFVLFLGEKTKIRTDGVSAILGLLEWRYELAETVLFHRTKLAAGAMLDRALFELWDERDEGELVSRLLPLSDDQLIDEALREATELRRSKPADGPRWECATTLLQKLRDRALFKELGTFDATNLSEADIRRIKANYAGSADDGYRALGAPTRSGARCRAQTARTLERDFELKPGSVAIYCSHIRPKIAEVSICVDDEIEKFAQYEHVHNERLSGGHLAAQIKRFERLWHIYFFIDAGVKMSLSKERFLLIRETITQVILGFGELDALTQRAKQKAMDFVHQEQIRGRNDIEFSDHLVVAAKSDERVAEYATYPNDAPSVRSFIRQRA